MEAHTKRLAISALILGLLGWSSFDNPMPSAYAQADEEGGILQQLDEPNQLTSVGEGATRVLSSNWQSLAADEQHTYRFDYDGDDQPVSVWMNVVPADGAEFQIWTDETIAQLNEGEQVEPLGVGSAIQEGSGFTVWQGSSADPATYYVLVNPNEASEAESIQYLLNITSPGLSITQTAAAALTPAVGITVTDVTTATGVTTTTGVATATDAVTAVVTPTVASNIAVVTTDALNVREGPSTAYTVITTVVGGTELNVLGRNATNTWLNVEVEDGLLGWVTRALTNFTGVAPLVDTPPLSPTVTAGEGATTTVPSETGTPTVEAVQQALDDDWQLLSGGETHWYTFQHQGGSLPVHVWMDVEPADGAGFRILDEENAQAVMAGSAPDDVENIGRGTVNPAEGGYLFWRGVFEEAGTFYVMVEQNVEGDVFYSIHAAGPGLSRPAPADGE